jgi:hypothetical protein
MPVLSTVLGITSQNCPHVLEFLPVGSKGAQSDRLRVKLRRCQHVNFRRLRNGRDDWALARQCMRAVRRRRYNTRATVGHSIQHLRSALGTSKH